MAKQIFMRANEVAEELGVIMAVYKEEKTKATPVSTRRPCGTS
nr:hypothetical protein [uncultured Agathobaculum sp.]